MDECHIPALPTLEISANRFPFRGAICQPDQITQVMIRQFLVLEVEHKRFTHHKRELISLLEQNAAVEPGRYALELATSQCRRLTAAHLIRELDLSDEFVDALRARTPLQTRRYLRVR